MKIRYIKSSFQYKKIQKLDGKEEDNDKVTSLNYKQMLKLSAKLSKEIQKL